MAAPTGLAAAACPAYPWPHDGAQRGPKVFMQSDCAACHSMLPHATLREAARAGAGEATAAEIVVMEEASLPATAATARHLYGGAYQPDLTLTHITKEMLSYNLYTASGAMAAPRMLAGGGAACEELKKKVALASPAWLQFLQPYMRTSQAA